MRPHAKDDATTLADLGSRVALLRVDAALRAAVPADELAVAERVVVATAYELDPGTWAPERVPVGADAFAALLVRGVITHETTIAGRRSAELLGPGDVFQPWRASESSVPRRSRWAADSGVVIAVLDGRFLAAARRWPQLFAVLHERLAEQLDRGTERAAIMALPRVEQRVLGLFWQLAERWGKVRPEGVVVELSLTHELIGQLIGAQRPTVSLALQSLAHDGLLRRAGHGAWLLPHDPRAALPDIRPIGPMHAAVSCARTRETAAQEPSPSIKPAARRGAASRSAGAA
jgi:CRP/FNR family transcriptional regulator, cyclic AMP receptor protein